LYDRCIPFGTVRDVYTVLTGRRRKLSDKETAFLFIRMMYDRESGRLIRTEK